VTKSSNRQLYVVTLGTLLENYIIKVSSIYLFFFNICSYSLVIIVKEMVIKVRLCFFTK